MMAITSIIIFVMKLIRIVTACGFPSTIPDVPDLLPAHHHVDLAGGTRHIHIGRGRGRRCLPRVGQDRQLRHLGPDPHHDGLRSPALRRHPGR